MGQQKHSKHTKPRGEENATESEPKHRHILLIELGISIFAIIFAWFAGNLFVSRLAVGNITVPARISQSSLQSTLQTAAANYRFTIQYPSGTTKTFSLESAGIMVDAHASAQLAHAASYQPMQLIAWWRTLPVTLKTSVNYQKLNDFITQNVTAVSTPAQNAEIHISGNQVLITPEKPGTQYTLENAQETLINAAQLAQKTPLVVHKTVLPAKITSANLAAVKAQTLAIMQQHITIHAGNQTITPNAEDIGNWLSYKYTDMAATIQVNSDAVHSYLAASTKSANQSARSQVLSASGAVLQAGAQGVAVTGTDETADALVSKLADAKGVDVTVPVKYIAFNTVSAPTLGKWIEVNTVTKRMYAYEQGQLVRSFLISAGAPGTPTVIGRFTIYAKYRSQNMSGENLNGSTYFQPAVPYVNYFYRDYAIHGNYWRPASYFGNINSSHGCVGIPVSDSAWMYNWAPIGTPVVIHT